MNLLQTDSSINPGNSGGGLFNGDGQLIGVVVAKSSGSDVEGLGFAIPINTAAEVAQQLMKKRICERSAFNRHVICGRQRPEQLRSAVRRFAGYIRVYLLC